MAHIVDPRTAGREAAERRAWSEAYDLLAGLHEPTPDDLATLADAAYWTERLEESLELRQRAHHAYVAADDAGGGAVTAIRLAFDYLNKGAMPRFSGWLATAERLLEHEPESGAHGLLEMGRAIKAEMRGSLDEALVHAERMFELGSRLGDRDLQALGLVGQGRMLLRQGELDRAFALLDEAATSAVSGGLDPYCSCWIYCATISSAHHVGDFERARDWTDAANRWCEREDVKGFPGACRVHRSEILGLGGEWEAAEREATNACTELGSYDVSTSAAGFYQIGEIRRRRGDFAAAEEAYRKAHELGADPQPGLALLRLAQGKVAEATSGLRRSLDSGENSFARARRLPAQVEISIAAGDFPAARAALAELEEITDSARVDGKRTPLLAGSLELAAGQIELADSELDEAEAHLRRAVSIWTGIGAPYEAATARMLLGLVYKRRGDREGASIEIEAARSAFERLGAVLDMQRAMEALGRAETRRTFMFTDIVDSTKLLEALGDRKWQKLLDRHDEILRQAIARAGGEVIKHTGDGFFAAFESPGSAVESAIAIQSALEDELLDVRIGLHSAEALERGNDYAGRGVNLAARIGAAAGAAEILASRETLEGMAASYSQSDPKEAQLKGFSEPVQLVSLAWR